MNLLELNNYLSTNKFVDIKLSSHDKTIIKLIKTYDVLYFTYLPNELKLIIIDILYPKRDFIIHKTSNNPNNLRTNSFYINLRFYDLYAFYVGGKYFTIEDLYNYDYGAVRHSHRFNKPRVKITYGIDINDSIYLYDSFNTFNINLLNNIGLSNIFCYGFNTNLLFDNVVVSYKTYHKK